jgi:hypothetical protein
MVARRHLHIADAVFRRAADSDDEVSAALQSFISAKQLVQPLQGAA